MQADVLRRRYGAYLFDLDGTLLDTAPDINAALNAALVGAALPPVTETLTRHWVGHGSRVLIEEALRFHLPAEAAANRIANESEMLRLRDIFIDYYSAHISDATIVYPGVREALVALAERGARLGVVTNKYTGLSIDALKATGLHQYFGAFVCGDTLPQRKPDPAPALHACALLERNPEDTLFVGDSNTDVETARAAGCAVVVVRDGYNHGVPAAELGADAVIDSFLELL